MDCPNSRRKFIRKYLGNQRVAASYKMHKVRSIFICTKIYTSARAFIITNPHSAPLAQSTTTTLFAVRF